MKKTIIFFIAALTTLPVFSTANEATNPEYVELCQGYAKDDGVSVDELDDYITNCVKDLEEAASESKD